MNTHMTDVYDSDFEDLESPPSFALPRQIVPLMQKQTEPGINSRTGVPYFVLLAFFMMVAWIVMMLMNETDTGDRSYELSKK
jgi:hypothetical protein